MTNERRYWSIPTKASLASTSPARFLTKMLDILDENEAIAHVVPDRRLDGLRRARRLCPPPGARGRSTGRGSHFWWGDER